MTIRPLTLHDEPLLWHFLMLAAHESELQIVQSNPSLARYVANWGRAGDSGLVAFEENKAIGAAWLRLWPSEDKGFGWLSDEVPELAMAVSPVWRARGIGTQLLNAVLQNARGYHHAISLSVRDDNPAARLYQRVGFTKVPGSETINRVGGVSIIMQRFL